jgi:glycosyltransferase involved in cell wall biosynthesis
MFLFSWRLYTKLDGFLRTFKPDLIIASSTYPLENFSIHRLAKKFNSKYCYEVHDLWPLSPIELGGISKHHPFMKLLQWSENYAYRHADFVVSLLPAAQPHMVAHGMKPEKFFYIPNGILIDEWREDQQLPPEHTRLIEKIKNQYGFLVAYAGSHGVANSLDSLLKAAKRLGPKAAIFLVGDGPEKKHLQEMVVIENIENVYFLPPVPKRCVPSLLKNFDVLYVGLQRQSIFRFGISPNKMIDYMMAGKPIVQAIEAGNNMAEEFGCGVAVEPENAIAIAEGIIHIKELSEEDKATMGRNGREAVLRFHDYKILGKKFLDAAVATH